MDTNKINPKMNKQFQEVKDIKRVSDLEAGDFFSENSIMTSKNMASNLVSFIVWAVGFVSLAGIAAGIGGFIGGIPTSGVLAVPGMLVGVALIFALFLAVWLVGAGVALSIIAYDMAVNGIDRNVSLLKFLSVIFNAILLHWTFVYRYIF